jgi:hypothetical protein
MGSGCVQPAATAARSTAVDTQPAADSRLVPASTVLWRPHISGPRSTLNPRVRAKRPRPLGRGAPRPAGILSRSTPGTVWSSTSSLVVDIEDTRSARSRWQYRERCLLRAWRRRAVTSRAPEDELSALAHFRRSNSPTSRGTIRHTRDHSWAVCGPSQTDGGQKRPERSRCKAAGQGRSAEQLVVGARTMDAMSRDDYVCPSPARQSGRCRVVIVASRAPQPSAPTGSRRTPSKKVRSAARR